ncbi:hypothetical protein IEQ34_007166 [Dendrobium chrysotoxum]|uniref:Ribosomal protein S14 n=1 Tax=Dendrobium chrysotoxum TaxID=161865 RepID=A0AAV7H8J6_DENCH|nr:hypothetical protein IEQ34_007166 [Dendrobium chrysotoxum]
MLKLTQKKMKKIIMEEKYKKRHKTLSIIQHRGVRQINAAAPSRKLSERYKKDITVSTSL